MGIQGFILTVLLIFLAAESRSQDQPLFVNQDGNFKLFRSLSERWELENEYKLGTFRITPYKPTYVLLGRYSTNPNRQPTSLNPEYSVPEEIPLNATELKFQISFKTKIYGERTKLSIWAAYSQKSHWQVYNGELSRPFRETNYEPEIIFNYRLNISMLGMKLRMAGVSLNHQSNGRSLPRSRSWNRVIFHAALESEQWQLYLKPWIRLTDEDDENPEITNFYGRMQVITTYRVKQHLFTLEATHSLRLGEDNRGSFRLDWAFPLKNYLRGRVEIFEGYGETLIDYNHRQFVIGAGVSLVEWR